MMIEAPALEAEERGRVHRLAKVEGLRKTLTQRGGMGQGVGGAQPWPDP